MNLAKRLLASLLLALAPFTAFAGGTASSTTVIHILVGYGYAWVQFSNSLSGGPSCGSGHPDKLGFNPSTVAGQSQLAAIQQAMILGQTVSVAGNGQCNVFVDTEDLSYIQP